ncbi:MAG: hypothetical protein CBE00_00080 [Planctomycetaceae bacterium TMED240]|nr:hypothetical protein [Rhodopirellula sp.]OUX09106.1 MAG: hypothetical protein CBE00_00080 [Planctomycetaceae bacterium TMED240]
MHIVSPCHAAAAILLLVSCCQFAHGQDSQQSGLRLADENLSLQRVPVNAGVVAMKSNPVAKEKSQSCVLLKNDNVLFGQARQLGEFVMVTTAAGGEIRLPRISVACWADHIRDLYQFRIDQRGKPDLRSHLHDAHWCVRYDLYDLAAKELIAARRIDPDNKEAIVLENRLRNLVAPRPMIKPVVARIGSGQTSRSGGDENEVSPASFNADRPDNVDFDPDTIRRFVSHIQPMLINRCGVCHQTMARTVNHHIPETKWHLLVPSVGSRASAAITRSNLQAMISYIDAQSPLTSPLLVMAKEDHGGSSAPLSQRNTKAIQSLEYWVKLAAESLRNGKQLSRKQGNASLDDVQTNLSRERMVVPGSGNLKFAPMHSELDKALEQSTDPSTAELVVPPTRDTPEHGVKSAPQRLPPVSNPFDPDLFNRRFHAAKSD